MTWSRLAPLALVLVLVLATAGCGGDDDGGAESWANGVCSNLEEWITDVDAAVRSLTEEGLDFEEGDVREAVDEARGATDELVADLRELGRPETEAGEQAEQELEELSDELREQFEMLEERLDRTTAPLELAATAAAATSAALVQLSNTLAALEQLDPGGELEDAFRNSEECDSLREQVEEIRS